MNATSKPRNYWRYGTEHHDWSIGSGRHGGARGFPSPGRGWQALSGINVRPFWGICTQTRF